jgi:Adenylate kinase
VARECVPETVEQARAMMLIYCVRELAVTLRAGDLLRKHAQSNTSEGNQLDEIMSRGKIVPAHVRVPAAVMSGKSGESENQ